MATLPLTPSGRLIAERFPNRARPDLKEAFVAPCNLVEEQLAQIWAEVLEIEHVGYMTTSLNWGHSLLTVELMTQVQKTFQMELPCSRLRHPL